MSTSFDGGKQKQGGIALLFGVLLKRLLAIIGLNLLFLVCCIPVITIPNALTALYRCTALLLKDEDFPLGKVYFSAFASEFFKTLAAGWILLLLLAGAGYGVLFYYSSAAPAATVFTILGVFLCVFLYAASCNLFYMLARVNLPLAALLKNAVLLVFMRPLRENIPLIASLAVLVACAWWFPRTLPLVALFACSLSALLACYGVQNSIEGHIIRG